MCLGAIYWVRPERVYFAATAADAAEIGFDDMLIYEELKKNAETRKIPMTQLMREDALNVFRVWEEKSDRIRY